MVNNAGVTGGGAEGGFVVVVVVMEVGGFMPARLRACNTNNPGRYTFSKALM